MSAYQPKTGERCSCRPGIERDNCPACEGTGQRIDFAAVRASTGADFRPLVVGTRKTQRRGPNDYRVVCATCEGGGTVRYETRDEAGRAAVRDSGKPCAVKNSRCRFP